MPLRFFREANFHIYATCVGAIRVISSTSYHWSGLGRVPRSANHGTDRNGSREEIYGNDRRVPHFSAHIKLSSRIPIFLGIVICQNVCRPSPDQSRGAVVLTLIAHTQVTQMGKLGADFKLEQTRKAR